MKRIFILSIAVLFALSVPAMACFGPSCEDNVNSSVSGAFTGYDSDGFSKDNGLQGASAFADGAGSGEFNAYSEGDKFAHTSGFGHGGADPEVGGARGKHWVAVGAKSSAGSVAGAFAANDGGYREAYAATYGGVYQNNSAYTTDGPGNFASGGNESGANYFNDDGESYDGTTIRRTYYKGNLYGWGRLNPWNYGSYLDTICFPGSVGALSMGGAHTAGGTVVYSRDYGNTAISFGATGNYAMGNDGVWGNGFMETGSFVSDGMSGAQAYTSGSFNYSGNHFGGGATFGGSVSHIGNGSASVSASHTSIATGNNGGQAD